MKFSALLFSLFLWTLHLQAITCDSFISPSDPAAENAISFSNKPGSSILGIYDGIAGIQMSTITYTFGMVLGGIGISPEAFPRTFAGKRVLLVAEGYGELLPELIKIGADVQAVDPLYYVSASRFKELSQDPTLSEALRPTLKYIADYMTTYSSHLVPGKSDELPTPKGLYDFVISHMLLNNMTGVDHSGRNTYLIDPIFDSLIASAQSLNIGGKALHVENLETSFLEALKAEFNEIHALQESFRFSYSEAVPTPGQFSLNNGSSVHTPKLQNYTFPHYRLITIERIK